MVVELWVSELLCLILWRIELIFDVINLLFIVGLMIDNVCNIGILDLKVMVKLWVKWDKVICLKIFLIIGSFIFVLFY